jgi:hypothetical protein
MEAGERMKNEIVVGRGASERLLRFEMNVAAARAYALLKLAMMGTVKRKRINCHGASEYVLYGRTPLSWVESATMQEAATCDVETALRELELPCGMQVQARDARDRETWWARHTAVLLGEAGGMRIVFNKAGGNPFELCDVAEVLDDYLYPGDRVAFYGEPKA